MILFITTKLFEVVFLVLILLQCIRFLFSRIYLVYLCSNYFTFKLCLYLSSKDTCLAKHTQLSERETDEIRISSMNTMSVNFLLWNCILINRCIAIGKTRTKSTLHAVSLYFSLLTTSYEFIIYFKMHILETNKF